MNLELVEIVKLYCTSTHNKLNDYLLGKSKDTLIAIINDLLTMYLNDKNSSTLREFITVTIAGYQHQPEKIGYNGFKQTSLGKTVHCEVKPKNIISYEFEKYKNKERKNKPALLNGGGNFTDYTTSRLEKDIQSNLNMLVSGFVDGRLIYILEFPFNIPSFCENLRNKLFKWEEKMKGSLSTKGQFLRSADFSYKDYMQSELLKIIYLLPKKELELYKSFIVKDFYEFLWKQAQ